MRGLANRLLMYKVGGGGGASRQDQRYGTEVSKIIPDR